MENTKNVTVNNDETKEEQNMDIENKVFEDEFEENFEDTNNGFDQDDKTDEDPKKDSKKTKKHTLLTHALAFVGGGAFVVGVEFLVGVISGKKDAKKIATAVAENVIDFDKAKEIAAEAIKTTAEAVK